MAASSSVTISVGATEPAADATVWDVGPGVGATEPGAAPVTIASTAGQQLPQAHALTGAARPPRAQAPFHARRHPGSQSPSPSALGGPHHACAVPLRGPVALSEDASRQSKAPGHSCRQRPGCRRQPGNPCRRRPGLTRRPRRPLADEPQEPKLPQQQQQGFDRPLCLVSGTGQLLWHTVFSPCTDLCTHIRKNASL